MIKSVALKCLLGSIIGVAGPLFMTSVQGSVQKAPPLSQVPAASLPTISLGSNQAPNTVEMYYSLSCVHCKDFEKTELPKIKARFIDKGLVRFVFHDFPIDPLGLQAAKIARCGPKDHYLSLVHILFKDQDNWLKDKGGEEALREIALKAGLTPEKYETCYRDKSLENAILAECLHARKTYKLDYAPAFVVNGKLFEGEMTEHALEKIISVPVPEKPAE